MFRPTVIIVALLLCTLPAIQSRPQPEPDSRINNKNGGPTVTVTGLDISDKALKLGYEIRNTSQHDIWICDDINWNRMTHSEVYLGEDGQTLVVRRRLGVIQHIFTSQPMGRYVRLPANANRPESLLIQLPVHRRTLFSRLGKREDTMYAVRLLLEIGYYTEDLPAMICSVLEKAEKATDKNADEDLAVVKEHMGGLLFFSELNERLSQRDDQVVVPYTSQALKGEHVVSARVDGQKIPYLGKPRYPEFTPPDLSTCTRVEIRYQPSMLEYFFPYAGQRSLLSPQEKEYLQPGKRIIVDDLEDLKVLADEVSNQKNSIGGIVCERSNAKVVCYRDDERLTSFTVYDDTSIETEQEQRIKYRRVLRSLKNLTPHVQPLELRMQCAANLKDLWYRYRLYENLTKSQRTGLFRRRKRPYPGPKDWCDAIVQTYWRTSDEVTIRPLKCLSAGEGKCHYAVNPDCKRSSPSEMVLLFETKAGWNQHGGPELFTFDNHDPKGGCVLLNDGTVKFIRTAEELRQLRWE
ncbi:MAG: hypothetical protein ACYSWW_15050 [Planctomycetota bacterium]|jgi:hypothetical protein